MQTQTTIMRRKNGSVNPKTRKTALINRVEELEASVPDTTPTPTVSRVEDFKGHPMVQLKNGKFSKKVSLAVFNLCRSISEEQAQSVQPSDLEDRLEGGEA
jgi:hypothetical protein